jgi:AraC-like DNA-binding protein
MSRSGFAARFTELVGEPAMRYVARWRMHVALRWLQEDSAGVGEMASRLGYQSEAAFSRAFKRLTGVSPGQARRGNPVATIATDPTGAPRAFGIAQEQHATDGAARCR